MTYSIIHFKYYVWSIIQEFWYFQWGCWFLDLKIYCPRMPRFHARQIESESIDTFSKKWLSEITKIPRPSDLVRKYRHFFKHVFCFNKIYLCLKVFKNLIVQKYQASTPDNSLNAVGDTNCVGPTRFKTKTKNKFHNFDVWSGRTFWNCWSPEVLRYGK